MGLGPCYPLIIPHLMGVTNLFRIIATKKGSGDRHRQRGRDAARLLRKQHKNRQRKHLKLNFNNRQNKSNEIFNGTLIRGKVISN